MSKKRDGGLDKTKTRGQLKFRWMFGLGVDVELALEAKLGKTAGWRTFFSGACLVLGACACALLRCLVLSTSVPTLGCVHALVPPYLMLGGPWHPSSRHGSMDGMEPIHARGRGARFYQVPGLKVPMQHEDAAAVLASPSPEGG